MMKAYIGTSGWHYNHWKGNFYPPDLPKSRWLDYLSSIFDTVEINATFYREPRSTTFQKWYNQTPEDFRFSIKASRFITHIKRLRDVGDSLDRFYRVITPLREKIGCLLFQFPPSLHYDPPLLNSFLNRLNLSWKTTIEVRNASFLTQSFYQSLKEKNIAFCWSDTAGRYPYAEEVTADFLYLRLHGSPILYRSSYTEGFLKELAHKLKDIGKDAFIYFDNDAEGHAPKNALLLKEYLS
ncbi:MAG: DUF72 domain-containing protein [Deltaproteobacteria bacterium]|nr:MAG: DUF72 domain-containing protein [Deltaproteobacteria bacterium]